MPTWCYLVVEITSHRSHFQNAFRDLHSKNKQHEVYVPGYKRLMRIRKCESSVFLCKAASCSQLSVFQRIWAVKIPLLPDPALVFFHDLTLYYTLHFLEITKTRLLYKTPHRLVPSGPLLRFGLVRRTPVGSEPRGEGAAGGHHRSRLPPPYCYHCPAEDRTADPRSGQSHIQQNFLCLGHSQSVCCCNITVCFLPTLIHIYSFFIKFTKLVGQYIWHTHIWSL